MTTAEMHALARKLIAEMLSEGDARGGFCGSGVESISCWLRFSSLKYVSDQSGESVAGAGACASRDLPEAGCFLLNQFTVGPYSS